MTERPEQGEAETSVRANLEAVRAAIEQAAKGAGRPAETVTLVAVSKAQPEARVIAALEAGERVFGENYVQPAMARWPTLLADYGGVKLHMIGPIQTNKAKDVVGLFDVIETVDREKLARALAKEMVLQNKRPVCLVQVNTGEEPQKAGIVPADLGHFLGLCREELDLPVKGLMCIPPVGEEPAMHFALLAKMAADHHLELLSMGMSADYETGVQFGATHVRVGSAIFGARPSR